MLLTISALTATGGVLYTGVNAYKKNKKKKERPWTFVAERRGLAKPKKKSKRTLSSQFSLGVRDQQLKEISSVTETMSEAEKEIDRHLVLSLSSLGLTVAGALIYPPLSLLSLPGLFYVYKPWFEEAYQSLFSERHVGVIVLDTVLVSGMLVTRVYVAAALIASGLSLSKKLLLKAEDHSQKRVVNVFSAIPRLVWIQKEQIEVQIPFEQLSIGDLVVVHAGETIAVDGTITEGHATVDQRILTGESQPAQKGTGDQVFALTVVLSGKIHIKAEKAGQETVAAQIAETLNRTADFRHAMKWQWMEFVDQAAKPVLATGLLALPILGAAAALSLTFALSGLGYGMRVVAPLTLLTYLNLASENSILIKDGRALELLSRVDTMVFDKTGTLTEEQPTVSEIYTFNGTDANELLTDAATAEYKQTHPIAKAILEEAEQRGLILPEVSDTEYEIGYGLKVTIGQKLIRVGSSRFMELSGIAIPSEIREIEEASHALGHSLICVAINEQLSGAIELKPTIRPEAKQIIQGLRKRGMSMYIISGDHQKPTQKLAEEVGIEHYFAETLPENKATLIEQLQKEGKCVCFVGDGINDSIALKKANLSISLRGASRVATDTAQIILMDESLNQLVELFDLGQQFKTNMNSGFWITLLPNIAAAGSALFLHSGVVASILLYYTSMAMGVGNSMWPLLTHKQE